MSETVLSKLARPLIVLATIIWGSTFFILKDTLDEVNLMFLLAFRFTFAAVLLAVVFWKRWKHIDRSYWLRGGVMGLFLFAAYTVQNFGLMDTTPGKTPFSPPSTVSSSPFSTGRWTACAPTGSTCWPPYCALRASALCPGTEASPCPGGMCSP